jgi:hypothetical protein
MTDFSGPVISPDSQNAGIPGLSIATDFTALFRQGMEKAAEFQKFAIDIYARQTTDALKVWKKTIPSSSPGTFFFDAAGQSIGTFFDMQKGFVDLFRSSLQ